MKFTFCWLKDHLETCVSPKDLEMCLTNLGLEVTSMHSWTDTLAPFCVGEVTKLTQHPEAQRLSVCRVATAHGEFQIVCGAANVCLWLKGIVALPGVYVPGLDRTLQEVSLRGVESQGMLCSYQEIGVGALFQDVPQGIACLSSKTNLYTPVAEVLGLDDTVFTIEVTPNRPDLLGVHGIARELSMAGVGRLKPLTDVARDLSSDIGRSLTISPEASKGCSAFALGLVDVPQAWAALPVIHKRLALIGTVSQEVLVDVTNYAAYDEPRPLHAFDADSLVGDVTLRLSQHGETFEALNGTSYTLDAGHMVVSDEQGIVSLAGVMGGMRSRIKPSTRRVLVESAFFNPSWISRTARKMNLITDASLRFERGVDPSSVMPGLRRALCHLEEAGGEVKAICSVQQPRTDQASFVFDPQLLNRLADISVDRQSILSLFNKMGLAPEGVNGPHIRVTIPSWRFDLEGEACLVEEIVRFKGYDAISSCPLPPKPSLALSVSATRQVAFQARSFLVTCGLREVINWSFIARSKAMDFAHEKDLIALRNPCSEDMEIMRPSLFPGLLTTIAEHQAHAIDMGCGLFEVGNVYEGLDPIRQSLEAVFVVPPSKRTHWQDRPRDLWQTKAYLYCVLKGLGVREASIQTHAISQEQAGSIYHPWQTGVLKRGRDVLAVFGALHPTLLERYHIQGPVYGGVLKLEAFSVRHKSISPPPPPIFQRIERDLGFVVPQSVCVEQLQRALEKAVGLELVYIDLFDIFEDEERLGKDKKSLSFRLTLQPTKAPANDVWIENHMNNAIEAVKRLGGILRRDMVA